MGPDQERHMLAHDIDSDLVSEFYEYIQDADVREAFIYLAGAFSCFRSVEWTVKNQGEVRSFRIYQNGKRYFSFMPSQKKLNFHFRPPVLKDGIYRKDEIRKLFTSFDDKSHTDDEHWAIEILNIDDARRLVHALALR